MEKDKNTFHFIIREIHHYITEKGLKAGDRLPSERELVDHLKVGRSSIREALRALEFLGFISAKRGEGTYIQEATSRTLIEMLALFLVRDTRSKLELVQMRDLLEIQAISLVAEQLTEQQLDELEMILKKGKENLEKGSIPHEFDVSFHKLIVKATGNSLFYRIYSTIIDFYQVERELKIREDTEVDLEKRLTHLHSILEALKVRDVKRAVNEMTQHLKYC